MKGEMFCGRFEENQLDKWIEKSYIKTSNPRLYKFLISFMLLGAAQGANAQTAPAQEKMAMQRRLDSLLNLESTKAERGEVGCDTVNTKGTQLTSYKQVLLGGVSTLAYKDEPLFILNGQLLEHESFSKLDVKKFKKITILKPAESQAINGSQGINGAVIITSNYTKKQLKQLL